MNSYRDRILVVSFAICIALPVPLDRALAALGWRLPGNALSRDAGSLELPVDLLDGAAGRKIEGTLLNGSYVARGASAGYNAWMLRLLRRAPPAAWLGDDEWIFVPGRTRDRSPEDWAQERREARLAITSVAGRLEAQGIDLLVVLVPDRARIYPDKAYRAGAMPPGKAAFLGTLVVELERSGIRVLDLSETLASARDEGSKVFHRTDHHWTSRGAELAADAIVSAVQQDPRFVAPEAGNSWPAGYISVSRGSLTRNLGLPKDSPLLADYGEEEPLAEFEKRENPPWSEACATYWASSYGRFGSPEFFAGDLGCPVRVRVVEGRGSAFAPEEDLRDLEEDATASDRHLVVWEIPEYHLVSGLNELN